MHTATDVPHSPAHGYRGERSESPRPARPNGLVVAISREAGARGGTIARKLGELLGWQVYDRDSLDYLVQDDAAREGLIRELPPACRDWASARLAQLTRDGTLTADPDTIALAELLLAVAARGDVIIVGRGAGYLLPVETTVHVRIVAPLESRVLYFAQWSRLSREEAAAEVLARDQRRARFLLATQGRDPADPTGYDLVVNSQRLGIEGAAQLIGWAVRTKQMLVAPAEPSAGYDGEG
jgi:hypothetical protein